MHDGYALTPGKGLVCRGVAAFFALVAAIALATPVAMLALTGNPLAEWRCGAEGVCGFRDGALTSLDEEERAVIAASPEAAERYAEHLARGPIWGGLAVLSVIASAPFAALMFGAAMALRSFGTSQGIGGAIGWLRLTALAALVAAIAPPLISLLKSVLLFPGTPHGPGWTIEIDGGPLLSHTLLAVALLAVVWALDAGYRAQRDLSEIV